jgi:hypothetical protein
MYHPPEGASPWTPALRTDLPGETNGSTRITKGKGKAREDETMEDEDVAMQDRGEPFIAVRSVETGVIDVSWWLCVGWGG